MLKYLLGQNQSVILTADGVEKSASLHLGLGSRWTLHLFAEGMHVIICGSRGSRSRGPTHTKT